MDALDQFSRAVYDDLERSSDLLERFRQCLSTPACDLSNWNQQFHPGSILPGLVLPEAAGAVSRDAGAGLSLLLHVDLRVEWDCLRAVHGALRRVAPAGARAPQFARRDP